MPFLQGYKINGVAGKTSGYSVLLSGNPFAVNSLKSLPLRDF